MGQYYRNEKGSSGANHPFHYSQPPFCLFRFCDEKQFFHEGLSTEDAVRHIAGFTAGIWALHPFCEGNTRATAAFIIKHLKTLGFADNLWYFHNALVRANYNDLPRGTWGGINPVTRKTGNAKAYSTRKSRRWMYEHLNGGALL